MDTIFISIASFCDPMLGHTIRDAAAKANSPSRLRFGVVDQTPERLRMGQTLWGLTRYVQVPPQDSLGACWARSVGMSLYAGEDWFFQIDSHMLFEDGWDDIFISLASRCGQNNSKFMVSSYPNAFEIVDNRPVPKPATQKVLGHVVSEDSKFADDSAILMFKAIPVDTDEPITAMHVGAGCIFAPGRIVKDLPYDPHFYFWGEEQALALRAFTHGWDMLHVSNMPIYHLYDTDPNTCYRPKHWAEAIDQTRSVRWWDRDKKSKQRLTDLVTGHDLGVFGLGRNRSIQDYADFCGVDYINRNVTSKAYKGPWVS